MTTAREATAAAPRTGAIPRELAILAGFLVLLIIAIATVLVPALRDDARDEDEQSHAILATPSGAAAHTATAPRSPASTSAPLMVPAPPSAPVTVPASPTAPVTP